MFNAVTPPAKLSLLEQIHRYTISLDSEKYVELMYYTTRQNIWGTMYNLQSRWPKFEFEK